MAASTYFDQVQQLYIAYFGRPADTVGQAYWATQIDAANGSIASVIAGFSASAESVALFGSATSAQKVTAIYQNAFGRAPEAAGLAYWVAQLDSGKVSQAQASWTIQQAAGPGDASAVNNKLIAAKAFTAQIDTNAEITGYNGAAAAALARAYLTKADATYASIANVAVDSVAAVGAATGTVVVTPPVTPVTPVPTFTATKDGGGVVTFANVGTAVSVTEFGPTFTFTSNGANAGTSAVAGPINGITVAASTTLSLTSTLATGIGFTGAGTIALTDTGLVTAATLKAIEAAITVGLVNATAVTATSGSVADAKLVLVTNAGTSGNKIDMGTAVAVTLNDLAASSIAATDLSAIGLATNGTVTVTNAINITGTVAEATAALVTAPSLVVAGIATLALSDTSGAAAAFNAIDGKTIGLITAASLTSVTGTVADIKTFSVAEQAGTTIAAITNYAVVATDTTVTAADLNIIAANNGNGLISTTNSGGWTITGLNNVTVGGTTSVDKFVITNANTNVVISNFTHTSDIAQLGGTAAAVATTVATPVGDVANRLVFDTSTNLGTNGLSIGDQSSDNNKIHWAVASDTGAIYYDADGNWTAGVVTIGTVGVVTGLAATDFTVG